MPDARHLIFVNYRGSDEIWATEFVYARMTEAFGADAVFKAGNALRPGDDFSPILLAEAAHCPVMLVCIGRAWLNTADADGERRLDAAQDWVREEIELSLKAGNRVVPLLIGNHDQVSVPRAEDLPVQIRELIERQAWRIAPGGGLDRTVPALVDVLAEQVPELGRRRAVLQEQRAGAADGGPVPRGGGSPPASQVLISESGDIAGGNMYKNTGSGTMRT
jgi:hypothetical protein